MSIEILKSYSLHQKRPMQKKIGNRIALNSKLGYQLAFFDSQTLLCVWKHVQKESQDTLLAMEVGFDEKAYKRYDLVKNNLVHDTILAFNAELHKRIYERLNVNNTAQINDVLMCHDTKEFYQVIKTFSLSKITVQQIASLNDKPMLNNFIGEPVYRKIILSNDIMSRDYSVAIHAKKIAKLLNNYS